MALSADDVAAGAAVVAVAISIWAAWLAKSSANSAKQQNHLALHQRRVDAYQLFFEYVGKSMGFVDCDENEKKKSITGLIQSCALIRFLFDPAVYEKIASFRDGVILHRNQKELLLEGIMKNDPEFLMRHQNLAMDLIPEAEACIKLLENAIGHLPAK